MLFALRTSISAPRLRNLQVPSDRSQRSCPADVTSCPSSASAHSSHSIMARGMRSSVSAFFYDFRGVSSRGDKLSHCACSLLSILASLRRHKIDNILSKSVFIETDGGRNDERVVTDRRLIRRI